MDLQQQKREKKPELKLIFLVKSIAANMLTLQEPGSDCPTIMISRSCPQVISFNNQFTYTAVIVLITKKGE